jgi:hypothetical protein
MVNVRFGWFGFMVFNVTFNNISVTYKIYIFLVVYVDWSTHQIRFLPLFICSIALDTDIDVYNIM